MKKKKFIDLKINIGMIDEPIYNQNIKIDRTVKNITGEEIITLNEISYFIVEYKINDNIYFSIYNKKNFQLIQEINSSIGCITYFKCFPLNENSIILTGTLISYDSDDSDDSYYYCEFFHRTENYCEIWKKDKNNKFVKNKTLDFVVISNFLFNSNSNLFFYCNYYNKEQIQVWQTNFNNHPISLISTAYSKHNNILEYTKIFFLKNENILVISKKSSISFYSAKTLEEIIYLENDDDFDVLKLDEKRILGYNSYKNKNGDNIIEDIQIMNVPEFKIVEKLDITEECNGVFIYKKYIMLIYHYYIELFNSENYEFIKVINIQDIYFLIILKDDYIIGLKNDYNKRKVKKNKIHYNKNLNNSKDLIILKFNNFD